MSQLAVFKLGVTRGIETMSSIDMVEYINAVRLPGADMLRHDNFMNKVPRVLKNASEFIGTQKYGVNNTRKVYNLPQREACLMAMSYSYELQAEVFDAWNRAVEANKPLSQMQKKDQELLDYANTLVIAYKEKEQALLQLEASKVMLEMATPKAEFYDAVVASEETFSVSHAAKILGIKPHKMFAWLRAKRYLQDNNVPYSNASDYIDCAYASGKGSSPTAFITAKGLVHFEAKLRKENNISEI